MHEATWLQSITISQESQGAAWEEHGGVTSTAGAEVGWRDMWHSCSGAENWGLDTGTYYLLRRGIGGCV